MFEKVIVAFDGSERARDALALSEILTAPDGELIVCCVHHFKGVSSRIDPAEPRPDEADAEQAVQTARRFLQAPATVTPLILAGAGVPETLQASAVRLGAELLVLGSSHRGPVGRVLVGSVTEQVLHGAPCAVAVAPAGFHRRPASLRRIVLGYDVVDPPAAALETAVRLASQGGGELQLIAVADTAAALAGGASAALSYPAIIKARLDAAEKGIARALGALPVDIAARGTVRDGRVAEELLEVTHAADLLVLGSRARGFLGRLVLGSVSDSLVRGSACPVLVVPPASADDARAQPERA